jgi:hypothetical protein
MMMIHNAEQKKKKKALRRELIIGGGSMLIILPLLLIAILGAGASLVIGVMMVRWMPDANIAPTMLVVYGILLTILLVFGYRFIARLFAVIRRMMNIRREQKRISEETRISVVETTEPVDERADGSEREMAPRRLTRR